jgi:hypothetical protein
MWSGRRAEGGAVSDYVYTVNLIGALGESVWVAYTDEQDAIRAAKKERWTGEFLVDAYVEKIAVDRSAPSVTVWKSWEDER